jgi:hypothetical protein
MSLMINIIEKNNNINHMFNLLNYLFEKQLFLVLINFYIFLNISKFI